MYQLQGYMPERCRHAKTGAKLVGIHQCASTAGISGGAVAYLKVVESRPVRTSAPGARINTLVTSLHSWRMPHFSVRRMAARTFNIITVISNKEAEA